MSPDIYTCKLPIVGSGFVCILNTEWTDREIKLLLLHDNHAWRGKFQLDGNEDMLELLDQLSLNEENYMEETKHALTAHDGATNFIYAVEKNIFTWKKFLREMTIKFGYVTLYEVPVFEAFEKIIDSTLHSSIQISEKLLRYEKQKGHLEEENQQLKLKLNDFIEKKNEMEKTLYSQCLCILNEKKKRIKELKKKLEPPDKDEQGSDELQSDTDPFVSDTEIDSEEEGKQSSSKTEVVKEIESLEREVEKKYILPKRRGQLMEIDSVAGPSWCNGKQQETKQEPALSRNKTGKKKSGESSCVLGKVIEDTDKNNSEEDVFMFPKRSKRITHCQKNVKPSTSKIVYESDDENYLDKAIKVEPDSDNTPSDVEAEHSKNTIKTEKVHEQQAEMDCVEEANIREKNKSIINGGNKRTNGKLNGTKHCKNKEYSASTLDMLNQLL